jgi:hypothetical protein
VSAASACPTGGPALSSNRRPSPVSDTLRVLRTSSVTRSSCSRCRTAWLTADVETPSSRAAPLKLCRRATARKYPFDKTRLVERIQEDDTQQRLAADVFRRASVASLDLHPPNK